MISTVTNLNIKNQTNNSIDSTTGDWTFVAGANNLYLLIIQTIKNIKLT